MALTEAESQALVLSCFAAINEGDLDALLGLVTDDVEFNSLIAEAEAPVFRGHDGIRLWWETVRGAFADVRWELIDVRMDERWAINHFRMSGVMSGVPLEQPMWQAVEQRDGKVSWWSVFRTEREALDAIALRR